MRRGASALQQADESLQIRGLALTDLLEALPTKFSPPMAEPRPPSPCTSTTTSSPPSLEKSGIATLETGDLITAAQARRLACQARILPAVLGGKSEVLDLGRPQADIGRRRLRIHRSAALSDLSHH